MPGAPVCHETKASAVWIGPGDTDELSLARRAVETLLDLFPFDVLDLMDAPVAHAGPGGPPPGPEPFVALLAADGPRRPLQETALRVVRRWPLCRVVTVGSSLCEGRRRSGPSLHGIEEVPWHDLPGRLACWLDDAIARRPGWLGQPATVRREDRLLEGLRPWVVDTGSVPIPTIALAAARRESLEGLSELLASFGSPPIHATVGRPSMEPQADVVIWETAESVATELPWLQLLAAHRPAASILMLESFPRGDRTREALRAGAAWVLGRPTPADVLLGTLHFLAGDGHRSGLGPGGTSG